MTGDRASGCLFGLAYGDALGAPTEFLPYDRIVARHGPGRARHAATGDLGQGMQAQHGVLPVLGCL